eukprot:contig_16598_g4039
MRFPYSLLLATIKAANVLNQMEKLRKDVGTLKSAFDAISRDTGVSVPALRVAYYRSHPHNPGAYGNATLSAEEDATLVALAQAFSMNNMPLSNTQVRQLVQRSGGLSCPRLGCGGGSIEKMGQLTRRACKAFSDKRASPRVTQSVEEFCMELEDLLEHHHFNAGGIMNYDETPIVNKGGRMGTQRVESAEKERANALLMRHSTVASLLAFGAAKGSEFLSVYVMKAKIEEGQAADINFELHSAPRKSRREWPRFSCLMETSFLDGDTLAQVVDLVATEWAVRNLSTNLLLFGDRFSAHVRPDTLLKARQMYLFFLPPNNSHFLQPIDASPFSTFHDLVRRSNEQLVIEGKLVSIDTRDALLVSAFTAER